MEQRRRDAAGDREAADEVPEGGTLLQRWASGRAEAIGDAATRPEGDAVVATAACIGTAAALSMSARVHEPRIDGMDVLPAQSQPLACRIEKRRDQDVC